MKKYLSISFLVILGLYFSIISPKADRYSTLKNEYASTLHSIQQAKRNLLLYDKIAEDWRLKEPLYEYTQKILPDKDDPSPLFDHLQLVANQNNVNIELNDSYHSPVNKDFYSIHYFGIKVSGQRVDLKAFFDDLLKGETLFDIIDVSLFSPRDQTSTYTAELIGKSYFFIPHNKATRKYRKPNAKAVSNLTHWLFPVFMSITCFWLLTMMVLYLLGPAVTSYFFKAPDSRSPPESIIESLNQISPSKRTLLIIVSCVLSALFAVAFIPELIIAIEYLRSLLNGNSLLYTKVDLFEYLDISSAGSILGAGYFLIVFLMSTALIIFILKRLHLKQSREIHFFNFFFFLCFLAPFFFLFQSFSFDHSQTKHPILIYVIEGLMLILFSTIPLLAARFTLLMLKGRINKGFIFRKKYPLLIFLTLMGLTAAALTGNWFMNASDFENRGRKYYQAGAYRTAISDLTRAIELDDTRFAAYKFRAMSYFKTDHYSKAISDFKTALKLNPDYKEAYVLSAMASDLKNDIHGAIMNLSSALHMTPGYGYAHHFKGTLYDSFGLYASAITDLNSAIALEPENVDSITARANSFFKAGLFKRAHTDFKDLVRLTPADSTAHLFRFIAAKRADVDETSALHNYSSTIDDDLWVSTVIKMLLNKITPEEMLKTVIENYTNKDIHSQCYFYAGQHYLLSGNRKKAIHMFEATLQSSKAYETIHAISKCELNRYGG